ncbi:hypothetical protein ACWGH4_34660, partial [Streptomyces sp. NPDC054847]
APRALTHHSPQQLTRTRQNSLIRSQTAAVHDPIAHALGRVLIPARRRSPYAREQSTFLDGARSPLARPYVEAYSCTAVQRRRRRALWLATVGVDIDQRNIHAAGGAW